MNRGGRFETEIHPKVKIEPDYDLTKPFKTEEDSFLHPDQFGKLLPGWNVKWNWFFTHRGLFVFRNPKGMTPLDFIQLTAKAIGGEAKISGSTVEFVPNIKEFRRREKGAIANMLATASDPCWIADYRFFDATLDAASNQQLEAVLSEKKEQVLISCPLGSRLRQLLDARILERSRMAPPSEAERFQGWMRDQVDLSAPAYAVLWRGMIPSAQLTGKAKNYALIF